MIILQLSHRTAILFDTMTLTLTLTPTEIDIHAVTHRHPIYVHAYIHLRFRRSHIFHAQLRSLSNNSDASNMNMCCTYKYLDFVCTKKEKNSPTTPRYRDYTFVLGALSMCVWEWVCTYSFKIFRIDVAARNVHTHKLTTPPTHLPPPPLHPPTQSHTSQTQSGSSYNGW